MKFLKSTKIYRQQFFVVAAFVLMSVVSCFYVSAIVRKQNDNYSESKMSIAELEIKNRLSEAENTINNIVRIIGEEYHVTASHSEIEHELMNWSRRIMDNPIGDRSFMSVYGYIDGRYVDGEAWLPDADYNPVSRPWYIGAAQSSGGIYYTDLYVDAMSGERVVSLSKEVFGAGDGESRGVLSIDMDAGLVVDYINTLKFLDRGYGILLNHDLKILSHGDARRMIGQNLSEIPGFSEAVRGITENGYISGLSVVDYNNESSVLYVKPLFNEWYVAIITPKDVYNSNVYTIVILMSFLALVLSCSLCYILAMLSKQKERSEQENLSKTTFLARISHEIRTPMNMIFGMTELILRKDITPDVYENTVNIKNASDILLSIVNDLLDYSKLESGNLEFSQGKYLFASLINDCIGIISSRITDKHVRFAATVDSAIPYELIGDETRVRQILLNVLSNAVKFTSEGFISLTAMAETDRRTNTVNLIFEIADSGVGIKEENISKIFDNYINPDLDSIKIIQGAGLGLTITKNLCLAMNGDITVYSKYGSGSVFTVTLPQIVSDYRHYADVTDASSKSALVYEPRALYANSIVCSIDNLGVRCTLALDQSMFYEELRQNSYDYAFVSLAVLEEVQDILKRLMLDISLVVLSEHRETIIVPDASVLSVPAHTLAVADILNNKTETFVYSRSRDTNITFTAPEARVLVVDDIKTNLQVAEGLMAPYKMLIDTAISGAQAIDLCAANSYDLVFMDHMMPEMDGIEAAVKIRALEDGGGFYKRLPIIALTANAMAGMKEKFIQSGMDDFLAKPIEMAKLNAILETWIPPDKREHYVPDGSGGAPEPEADDKILIPGLDTQRGIIMTGGSKDGYLKTLTVYYFDTKQKTEELNAMLEKGDITAYAISVHALKSASASIGATQISYAAAALEDAARDGNMPYIEEYNGKFLRQLEELVSEIKKIVIENEPETADNQDSDIPALYNGLIKLKAALDEMDMSAIDTTIQSLTSKFWEKEINTLLSDISKNVLIFEYDSAKGVIDEIIEKYIE